MLTEIVWVFLYGVQWCTLASAAKTAYSNNSGTWTHFAILWLNFKTLFCNYKLLSPAFFCGLVFAFSTSVRNADFGNPNTYISSVFLPASGVRADILPARYFSQGHYTIQKSDWSVYELQVSEKRIVQ